jgi:hypothetical protein
MFGDRRDCFRDLRQIAAGFFDAHDVWNFGKARERCGFEVRAGASGDVVEDDGLVADGFGDRLKVAILAFLRGLVVVGRRGEDCVDSRPAGEFFGLFYGFVCSVGRSAGDDGDAASGDFDGCVDDVQPFVVRERGRFTGRAAGNEEIDARVDLPCDQVAQGRVVERAILMERSNQRSAAAAKLHGNKIARMLQERKIFELKLDGQPRAAVPTLIAVPILINCQRYNAGEMSRLFESFEYLDRGWDIRVLESLSLRSIFVSLLLLVFFLGADVALTAYQTLRFHHFDWLEGVNMLLFGVLGFRYSRLVYRRLSR